jgi:hypothetical protein
MSTRPSFPALGAPWVTSGSQAKLPDVLQNVPESAFGRMAHGSIRIQEGEPFLFEI